MSPTRAPQDLHHTGPTGAGNEPFAGAGPVDADIRLQVAVEITGQPRRAAGGRSGGRRGRRADLERRHDRAVIRRHHASGVARVEHLRALQDQLRGLLRIPDVVDPAVARVARLVAVVGDRVPLALATAQASCATAVMLAISAAPGQALKSPAKMCCCEKLAAQPSARPSAGRDACSSRHRDAWRTGSPERR